jgi:UDP-N-acetyl-D-galactosamine dehydrogenase
VSAGRTINDDMGRYAAEQTVKQLIKAGIQIKGARAAVFGVTFKEDCPDVRNSKVIDVINELAEYGVESVVIDDVADKKDLDRLYGLKAVRAQDMPEIDVCIFAVAHAGFKNTDMEALRSKYRSKRFVLIDLKGIFDRDTLNKLGFMYWRL